MTELPSQQIAVPALNPFAISLQSLRRTRRMRQKALARALGVDASYLCAIENGRKLPPRNADFFSRLQTSLDLSEEEVTSLRDAGVLSHELGALVAGVSPRQSVTAVEFFRNLKKMKVEHLRVIDAIISLATGVGTELNIPHADDAMVRAEFITFGGHSMRSR